MTKHRETGSRYFLAKLGFSIGKTPEKMNKLLLRSLSAAQREELETIWTMRNSGFSNGLELYRVPQTVKQAALLCSHDWPRTVASFDWFEEVVSLVRPSSVVEMGSGPGFLLAYLHSKYPSLTYQGIDLEENLARIGSQLCNATHIVGDYRELEADRRYDLVACNFGFDLARFRASTKPHSSATVAGQSYCPGCSDDLKDQLAAYMQAWRRWGGEDAVLAVTGRIQGIGELRAFALAASEVGWLADADSSKVLKVRDVVGRMERFPALLFRPCSPAKDVQNLEELAVLYGST